MNKKKLDADLNKVKQTNLSIYLVLAQLIDWHKLQEKQIKGLRVDIKTTMDLLNQHGGK